MAMRCLVFGALCVVAATVMTPSQTAAQSNEDLDDPFDEDQAGSAIARRHVKDEGDLDITPMIDITFLLLIFFLVASTSEMQDAVKLPEALEAALLEAENKVA